MADFDMGVKVELCFPTSSLKTKTGGTPGDFEKDPIEKIFDDDARDYSDFPISRPKKANGPSSATQSTRRSAQAEKFKRLSFDAAQDSRLAGTRVGQFVCRGVWESGAMVSVKVRPFQRRSQLEDVERVGDLIEAGVKGGEAGSHHVTEIFRCYQPPSERSRNFVVQEWFGRSLEERVRAPLPGDAPLLANGRPTPAALQLAHDLCSGLAWLHEHGVVHGNLSPTNAFVRDADGAIALADIGLDVPPPGACRAPEVTLLDTRAPPSTQADAFALGLLLCYVLCDGKERVLGGSAAQMEDFARRRGHPPVPDLPDVLDESSQELIGGLLRWDPKKRSTVAEAAAVLKAQLGSSTSDSPLRHSAHSQLAPPVTPGKAGPKRAKGAGGGGECQSSFGEYPLSQWGVSAESKEVDLKVKNLGPKDARVIASVLFNLTRLSCFNNLLADEGVAILAAALEVNTTLTSLDLGCTSPKFIFFLTFHPLFLVVPCAPLFPCTSALFLNAYLFRPVVQPYIHARAEGSHPSPLSLPPLSPRQCHRGPGRREARRIVGEKHAAEGAALEL